MTEDWVPENKSELMAVIRREWHRLMDTVEKLTQAGKMTATDEGGWSPKDNLAHISEWMNSLMGYHMDRIPAHEAMQIPEKAAAGWDMEVINPILFQRNKDRSLEDVLEELKRTYEKLVAKLDATPYEELLEPRHADDPEKRPLLLWVIGDTSDHFAEHRETIERML